MDFETVAMDFETVAMDFENLHIEYVRQGLKIRTTRLEDTDDKA